MLSISSRFSGNPEAYASGLPENLEEMFPIWVGDNEQMTVWQLWQ